SRCSMPPPTSWIGWRVFWRKRNKPAWSGVNTLQQVSSLARMHLTDEALAAAYIEENDQRAFSLLIERHQERVFGFLFGMVRDRDVANDLFQETFLRVIRAMRDERGSYSHQGRWLAWVMRIARNAALDYLRKQKKWRDVDDEENSFWDRLPDGNQPADDRLDLSDRMRLLESCLQELPEEQREVLLLRHDAELTFREIAELTGVSINTALGRMRYALLNLRKLMEARMVVPADRVRTT